MIHRIREVSARRYGLKRCCTCGWYTEVPDDSYLSMMHLDFCERDHLATVYRGLAELALEVGSDA